MRIGYHPETEKVYFLFGDPEWKSLKAGKTYPMQFVFDGRDRYEDDMLAHDISGDVVLTVDDVSDDFIQSFAERHAMEISYRGKVIARLSLQNTYAAINEVGRCQQSQATRPQPLPKGGDPFK
jgi:hypothetical protein